MLLNDKSYLIVVADRDKEQWIDNRIFCVAPNCVFFFQKVYQYPLNIIHFFNFHLIFSFSIIELTKLG